MVVAINSRNLRSYKVVLLGDIAVGKTSVISSLKFDVFADHYKATIAPDYFPYVVTQRDGSMIKLSIWDTAGQEKFRSIIPTFLRDVTVCVLVYDISNRSSFDHVRGWFDFVKEQSGDRPVQFYLFGNKSDLEDSREVSPLEGAELAETLAVCYFAEVSAKECKGIKHVFQRIAEDIPVADDLGLSQSGTKLKVDRSSIRESEASNGSSPFQSACGC